MEENVKFGLKLKKMSKDEQDEIAAKYLKAVGLDKFAKSFPKGAFGRYETEGSHSQSIGK